MSQIFEIFNSVDGATLGHRFGEARAKQTVERCGAVRDNATGALTVMDYLPAKPGFYVLDMRDNVKEFWQDNRGKAEASVMIHNQSSDTNSFRIFEQVL